MISMTDTAEDRANVLQQLESGRLSETDAEEVLGLGPRHLRRLRARLHKRGIAGLIHGNQGRVPANAIPQEIRDRVVALAKERRYLGMNHTYFAEMLASEEGIFLSPATVTRMLKAAGIKPPRQKRRKKCFRRRTPRRCAGMLVQIDASKHRWIAQLPEFTIVAGVDDATGKLWALIRPTEDARGYFELIQQIALDDGVPGAAYTDRHSIFGSNSRKKRDVLAPRPNLSQFGRALSELKVRHIKAQTAQAKGRIERNFDTLQDRLVSWFQFEEITSMDDAVRSLARYLVQHNRRFVRVAADPVPAWKPRPSDRALEDALCLKYTRRVRNDNTISFQAQFLDLPPGPNNTSYARQQVQVFKAFDGTIRVFRGKQLLTLVLPGTPAPFAKSPRSRRVLSEAHRPAQSLGLDLSPDKTGSTPSKQSSSRQLATTATGQNR